MVFPIQSRNVEGVFQFLGRMRECEGDVIQTRIREEG